MTTIIIKDGKKLSKKIFQTYDELIEEYYASKGIVLLNEIEFESLSSDTREAINKSKETGREELINFKG